MNRINSVTNLVFSGTMFKMLYLSLALLSFNSFTHYQPWMKYFILAVTAFGALNILYRLKNFKNYIKTPYLIIGVFFLLSYIITTVINRRYGLLGSAKGLVWLTFQILLLYCCDYSKPVEFIKAEFKKIGLLFVSYTTVACVISIFMLASRYEEKLWLDDGQMVFRGFIWGRLWGVFSDPNYASVSVCISIVLCLYFFSVSKKWYYRVPIIFSLVFSFLYLVFSDSRTGYVTLFCCVFAWVYLKFFEKIKAAAKMANKRQLLQSVIAVSIALVVSLGAVGAIVETKEFYNCAVTVTQNDKQSNEQSNEQPNEQPNEQNKPLKVERSSEIEKTDLTNRRLDIWKSGFDIFQTSPVIGVGFRNIIVAAKEKAPDTYIINSLVADFDAFHNMFIDVLVSQGLVGFLLFMSLAVLCAISILRLLLSRKTDHLPIFSTLLAVVIASVVSSFFLSDTVYVNSPNAVIFWIFLGYIMRIVVAHKENTEIAQPNLHTKHRVQSAQ